MKFKNLFLNKIRSIFLLPHDNPRILALSLVICFLSLLWFSMILASFMPNKNGGSGSAVPNGGENNDNSMFKGNSGYTGAGDYFDPTGTGSSLSMAPSSLGSGGSSGSAMSSNNKTSITNKTPIINPEPVSSALFLLGGAGLALLKKLRKK